MFKRLFSLVLEFAPTLLPTSASPGVARRHPVQLPVAQLAALAQLHQRRAHLLRHRALADLGALGWCRYY